MHGLEKIRSMLMEEIEKCSMKNEITSNSLENIDKLTHAVKSIDAIMAMEEAGYSNGYSNEGSYDDRGRGSNARRDSMGRYADSYERSYGGSYRNSYRRGGSSNRGYSRDEAKADLMANLRDLSREADGEQKQMIDEWMRQVEMR